MNIKRRINDSIIDTTKNFQYTKDNLLCFSVSIQPNFLVWSSALACHAQTNTLTKEIALENAREEIFGLMGEGSHAPLSRSFFQQLGNYEIKHYEKARNEISEIYNNFSNHKILLTFLTCLESWSAEIMPKILKIMEENGATDFYYIDIHKAADNIEDGHSIKFLRALASEKPEKSEVEKGIQLFENFSSKIFE